MKFVATKKGMTTNCFPPLSSVDVFGSGMGKNQDPELPTANLDRENELQTYVIHPDVNNLLL